jgi:HSP20 family molecular chaperone IbpA
MNSVNTETIKSTETIEATETIKAEYKNRMLTVELPKRAESKPPQVNVKVTTNGNN